MKLSTHYMGKAGEYAVASELLARGLSVHLPSVDDGIDLLAGGILRLQVKTSVPHSYRFGGYVFTLSKRIRQEGYQQYRVKMMDWFAVDYLICCGMGEPRRFWIIPSAFFMEHCPQIQSLMLGTAHHKAVVDHDEIVALLKSGKSQADVARELEISPMVVSEHARGKSSRSNVDRQIARMADVYESNWDGLLSNVKLNTQIEMLQLDATGV